jgi:hypothetical protein
MHRSIPHEAVGILGHSVIYAQSRSQGPRAPFDYGLSFSGMVFTAGHA